MPDIISSYIPIAKKVLTLRVAKKIFSIKRYSRKIKRKKYRI